MTDWRRAQVAPTRTHHLVDGCPVYTRRFREVLKFHEPGLAPAVADDGALHIDVRGEPVYERRFVRTFGFYESLAAVHAGDGWHHVHPDGSQLGPARYAWCGNFQGGRCAVRGTDGRYFHIDETGAPAYPERYRYAGDFRDANAVVQRDDGLHTHIDARGRLTHGAWFLDLDVFHKGHARARDEDGWHHVDERGRQTYERRFATVEPFYNGQSRVERLDGGLEVIDERGARIIEIRSGTRSAFADLSADMVGFWRTQAIGAAVELRIFDALPGTTEAVAVRCGLRADRTERLLRGLGELRLVHRLNGAWSTTDRGDFLRRDHAFTLADAAAEYAGRFSQHWSQLPDAVRMGGTWQGGSPFDAVVAEGTAAVVGHHRMLASYASHDYRQLPDLIDGDRHRHLIDAGSGLGVVAKGLLARYAHLRVTLLDRPEVIAQVSVPDYLGHRLSSRAIDILGDWGEQGDAVILARVLHDWDDHHAVQILRRARAALPAGGSLYVVEMVRSESSFGGSLCDLHLLVVHEGKERTLRDYEDLLMLAHFDLVGVQRLDTVPSVVRAVAR